MQIDCPWPDSYEKRRLGNQFDCRIGWAAFDDSIGYFVAGGRGSATIERLKFSD